MDLEDLAKPEDETQPEETARPPIIDWDSHDYNQETPPGMRPLRDCPFCCGSNSHGERRFFKPIVENDEPNKWRIVCYACGASMHGRTKEEVFMRWNRREWPLSECVAAKMLERWREDPLNISDDGFLMLDRYMQDDICAMIGFLKVRFDDVSSAMAKALSCLEAGNTEDAKNHLKKIFK